MFLLNNSYILNETGNLYAPEFISLRQSSFSLYFQLSYAGFTGLKEEGLLYNTTTVTTII